MNHFETRQNRQIAYVQTKGKGPGVIFLGGFKSDMTGNKALHLETWAQRTGNTFLRFDYSGHGQSNGHFEDGAISDWFEDALAVLELTDGPQVLVGSSMGGWISLLVARHMPQKIAGLVTIAAAPDFTEDKIWSGFSPQQRDTLEAAGKVELPSEYSEDPYVITRRLIEDGRQHLIFPTPLELPFPVRFLQGTADVDVKPSVALRLLEHAQGPDIRLNLIKSADHRFSNTECLALIEQSVEMVLERARNNTCRE